MQAKKNAIHRTFEVPLWLSVGYGSLATGLFYSLIVLGPLDHPEMRRYAMGHPVCYATVWLFAIAAAVLACKIVTTRRQAAATARADDVLLDLLPSLPEGDSLQAVRWLDSMWRAQKPSINASYLGDRVTRLLRLQIQRGGCDRFDEDLASCGGEDADAQHDSWSIVRIVCWAMPMLGFLGTVVGISQTLGHMDMKLLASGDDAAMDALTGGLYVAFDTTAIALVLTIVAMFAQFTVSGRELRLLQSIDRSVADRLYGFLKPRGADAPQREEKVVRELADRVVDATAAAVGTLTLQQQQRWAEALAAVENRQAGITERAASVLEHSLQVALDRSLTELTRRIDQVQSAATDELQSRFQQWQTSLSEQSRLMLQQQHELTRQGELLTRLIDKCERFESLDQSMQHTLQRLTDVDRFHEAAIAMTEAIAVLGIQLERNGQIGPSVRVPRRTPTGEAAADRKAA